MKVYTLKASIVVADDVSPMTIQEKTKERLEELADVLAGNVGGVRLHEVEEVTIEDLEKAFAELEPAD